MLFAVGMFVGIPCGMLLGFVAMKAVDSQPTAFVVQQRRATPWDVPFEKTQIAKGM